MSNIPDALLKSLEGVKGFNKDAFLRAHELAQPLTAIRLNPTKQPPTTSLPATTNHQLLAEPSTTSHPPTTIPWCTTGRFLPERPSFTFDPLFHAGAYYVQEASSMFLHHILNHIYKDAEPQTVLDLCAAPGGKSTLLAARFPSSFIVANEVIKSRVTILAENITKWGSDHVTVTHNDPKDFKKLQGFFDLLVIDAPCSGSGLFRKDANAIDEWSEANVQMCSHRQQRIIADALSSLKQSGILIYSTCSYSKEENENVCDWITEVLNLQSVQIPLEESWGIVETSSDKHGVPGYRFYPDKIKGEGFFVACFKKQSEEEETFHRPVTLPSISKTELATIEPWLADPSLHHFIKQQETIIALPRRFKNECQLVRKILNVRKSGIAIGAIKGAGLVPHHELALSGLLNSSIPLLELDLENALLYLKRKEMNVIPAQTGWMIVRHKGLNLGWIKALGNRINNYYPTDWRILKD